VVGGVSYGTFHLVRKALLALHDGEILMLCLVIAFLPQLLVAGLFAIGKVLQLVRAKE
jgi:hypothetical protein